MRSRALSEASFVPSSATTRAAPERPAPARRSGLAATLALVVLGSACATTGGAASSGEASLVGQRMPDLTVAELRSGRPLALAALRGKVVLLDIWASWCAPCKDELPLLDDLARRLAGKGVEVVAISIDEDRQAAEEFLASRKSWALTLAHDPQGRVPDRLQPPKMPTSYVIDARGILRHLNAGFERGDLEVIESKLRELAAAR
jgi:thiol-disulfide isomerase/thioredoxin